MTSRIVARLPVPELEEGVVLNVGDLVAAQVQPLHVPATKPNHYISTCMNQTITFGMEKLLIGS